ncbi:hypothetical protein NDU88_005484 [Pleurodeles waltl]|uniref:Uncharacterized protein n=1 Tax=Pleurodeles waltl TaxID=8319 RepID=A0AAV7WBM5_PLEWA|nr:hypothetical protein NDU88_005484 [Pleurodeles waltl]
MLVVVRPLANVCEDLASMPKHGPNLIRSQRERPSQVQRGGGSLPCRHPVPVCRWHLARQVRGRPLSLPEITIGVDDPEPCSFNPFLLRLHCLLAAEHTEGEFVDPGLEQGAELALHEAILATPDPFGVLEAHYRLLGAVALEADGVSVRVLASRGRRSRRCRALLGFAREHIIAVVPAVGRGVELAVHARERRSGLLPSAPLLLSSDALQQLLQQLGSALPLAAAASTGALSLPALPAAAAELRWTLQLVAAEPAAAALCWQSAAIALHQPTPLSTLQMPHDIELPSP